MNNDLNNNNEKKAKRDPDERVAHMNEIFDKYVLPLLLFTVAVFVVFGLIVPGVRSCSEKNQEDAPSARSYSSAEFYVRRTDFLNAAASDSDLFEKNGYTVFDDESLQGVAYKELESGDEIMENVTDPNGNHYSVIMSADSWGKKNGSQNLSLMVYSGSIFLAMAEKEDGTHSALFNNDKFTYDVSASDVSGSDAAAQRDLLEAVSAGEWTRMIGEYKDNLTPALAGEE